MSALLSTRIEAASQLFKLAGCHSGWGIKSLEVDVKAYTDWTRIRKGNRKLTKSFRFSTYLSARQVRAQAEADLGAELVEFALVLPLLCMLLLGIVWMGRAYNVYETITRAAREGARYAVLPSSVAAGNTYADTPTGSCSSDTATFNNHVVPVLLSDSLDPSHVEDYCQQATWLEDTYPRQCGVVVSFSYPIQLQIPFTALNATTIRIGTQAQMRLENQPTGGTCP